MMDGHPAPQAIRLGSEAIAGICTAVEGWAKDFGKPKRTDLLNLRLELDDQILVSGCLPAVAKGGFHMWWCTQITPGPLSKLHG